MSDLSYTDDTLRTLFGDVKTIALVGASPRGETRASWRVMRYLQNEGYKVYPVNPDALGQEIHGEKVYASVTDLPEKIDMVDIFRLPWKVAPVVDEAIALGVPYIWMQLKVINEEAAAKAEAAGATVIMDRCPAIELPRLQATA
ncbi:MAG: CoA-binding protein [Rhodospirillaceae bacterium]|mgnify:CR=1 FL=1|jgi:predicted CoA-binding protein|nr:CoA-binding protein [Rhodospirillaceae bacterium]MBT4774073.1 CoA-binding protein [Rhodospirillaceae bacterium]MBT5357154.1 CoA-binding protein [Rhodospirillaceae bacterium]MBT5770390.1 CoA-binding protein [Rhodospirillaceae bacterium]MBT6310977.1 CoA-binding protein [Rhodospirillaceae bacterium]